MVHEARGFRSPITNNHIANVYGEIEIATDDQEFLVSPMGLSVPNYPTDSGELVYATSDDVADSGQLKISGLDENFIKQTEIIQVSGTSLVPSTKPFTRINNISWLEQTAFQGNLGVFDNTGIVQYRSASPEAQLSLDAVYTIPANRTYTVEGIYSAVTRDSGGNATSLFSIYVAKVGFPFSRPFKFALANSGSSSNFYNNPLPLLNKGPADIYMSAIITDASAGTPAEVVSRLSIKLNAV